MKHALAAQDLWSSARAMLQQILFLIGSATAAAILVQSRKRRAEVLHWLAPLESFVRKLLLIEAAALSECSARRRRSSPTSSSADRTTDNPRAPVFVLLPASRRERDIPARIRQLGPPLLVADIWREQARDARIQRLHSAPPASPGARLANRIRALQRTIEKPIAHARRLARLLARAKRATDIARVIAFALLRSRPLLFHDTAFNVASNRACAVRYCDSG